MYFKRHQLPSNVILAEDDDETDEEGYSATLELPSPTWREILADIFLGYNNEVFFVENNNFAKYLQPSPFSAPISARLSDD